MSKPILSIVVCTYNGEPFLPDCFQSIEVQTALRDQFEVIIVNNNSTDGSMKLAQDFAQTQTNVKVVNEEVVGLSAARNRGFDEAEGEYVSYLDDDAKLSNDWVERALQIIADKKPDIFGGPIFPFYKNEKPYWYKDEFGTYNDYKQSGALADDQFLSGSNVVFHRPTYKKLGGFDVKFGMKGEEMGYGEETVLIQRARKEIHDVNMYYDHDLRVYHLVPEHKMKMLYFLVNAYASGRSWSRINRLTGRDKGKANFKDLKDLLQTVGDIYSGANQLYKLSTKGELEHYEPFVLDMIVPAISNLGVLHDKVSHSIEAFNPGAKLLTKIKHSLKN